MGKRLTIPAVMTLESVQPLNYLGSQMLVFFYPFVTAFLKADDYRAFQEMLEHRQSIHYIIETIEQKESEWTETHKRKGKKVSPDSKVKE